MISYEEARALKFFFIGLAKYNITTVNLSSKVWRAMQDLATFGIAYERISITNDVLMELVDYLNRMIYEPINLNNPIVLNRHVCLALDLAPIFWKTESSSLKYKSNYLLKKEHIEYYFEVLENLNEAVKEQFTSIDVTKYIMAGKQ